jgi:uncharacterized membrane protein
MSLSEFLLFIHILASMVWVGGSVLALVLGTRMKDADQSHRLGFARAMKMVSQRVFMPAAILVLVFGTWLVLDSDFYDFEQLWISIGFVAVLATAAMGPAFFKPTLTNAIAAIEADDGLAVGAAMARLAMGSRIAVLIQVVALWAMVVKPGLG